MNELHRTTIQPAERQVVRYPCPRKGTIEARLPFSVARGLALKIYCLMAVLLLGVHRSERDPLREFDQVSHCD